MNEFRTVREEAGLTRNDVVVLIGIPYRTLQDYESGTRTPPEWVKRLLIKEMYYYAKKEKSSE